MSVTITTTPSNKQTTLKVGGSAGVTVAPIAAILNSILDAFVQNIQGLSLSWSGNAPPSFTNGVSQTISQGTLIPVVKRKLPKKDESLNPPVQIVVYPKDRVDELRFMAFGRVKMKYSVGIAVVSPSNNDNLANLSLYTMWRRQIQTLFQKPPLKFGPPQVWDLNVQQGTFLNRSQLSTLYDYQEIVVDVITAEAA